jgi:hypothetical protein
VTDDDASVRPALIDLAFHILIALGNGPGDGYAIGKDVEEESGGRLDPSTGTLYQALDRLKEEGLIASVEPSERSDERRKYFKLTMSYIVSQRTGEIGVRLALGADPGHVAGLIIRQGGFVAIAGVSVGLASAGSRLIASLLYGVSARDPAVFAATTVLLLCVALLACWLPARRGARLSPLDALRTE